jgi:hypothetical protein
VFEQFTGSWKGTSRLYLEGGDGPALESPSDLSAEIAIGNFLQLRYDWAYEGKQKQGLILFGNDAGKGTAAWIDSFHTANRVMAYEGSAQDGVTNVKGSYSVGDGPDWHWRIHLELAGPELRLTMFNISPDGQEDLAVQAVYQRAK